VTVTSPAAEPAPSTDSVSLRQTGARTPCVPFQPTTSAPPPLNSAGRNLLFGEIARGGMGAVLRGYDPMLGRELAVKVLLESHRDHPELVQRFLEEAQIGGQLQHPGVVPVYELGRFEDDRPFFTMKLVKGQTLAELLAQRATLQEDLPRFLTIFEQICQTMAYAHARGVLHRDLKPSNIMVGAFGEVQVMDWGLAKVLPQISLADEPLPAQEERTSAIRTARSGPGSDQSLAGTILGTPAFMPPEQASGEVDQLDERADVFGLGAILCMILTGQPPYQGRDSREELCQAVCGDLGDCFARLDQCGADAELVRLCKECLAPQKQDRPRDADQVARRVADYQAGVQKRLKQAELDRAAAEVKAGEERKRRRLTAALAAAVLALVAGGSLSGLYWQQQVAARTLQEAGLCRDAATALEKASVLQDKARWAEARLVLEQARERLGTAGPEDLRHRLGQALSDLTLVTRLDDIRQKRVNLVEGKLDYRPADQAYAAVFREAGLADQGVPAEVVAARIRDSAVADQLVAALDDWALVTQDAPRRAWLLEIARQADQDTWRDRFRDPQVWQDRAKLDELANELLHDETRLAQQQPQLLAALGGTLQQARGNAVPLLLAAQAQHPNDFWLNFLLGYALDDAQRWDEAIGYYRVALALRPDSAAAYTSLGWALYQKKQLDEASRMFRKAMLLDPKYAWPRYDLGLVFFEKGQREAAVQEYQAALALDAKLIPAYIGLSVARLAEGQALVGKGQLDEAIKVIQVALADFRKALEIDPRFSQANVNQLAQVHLGLCAAQLAKAMSLVIQGKQDAAIQEIQSALGEFRKARELDPKVAQATSDRLAQIYVGLGVLLRDKGQADAAIDTFRQALELDHRLLTAHQQLANLLQEEGRLAEAIEEYRVVLALDPKQVAAHIDLGRALDNRGQRQEAIQQYRKALEIDPKNSLAHNNIGWALRGQGQFQEAIQEFRSALELDANNTTARNNLRNTERRVELERKLPAILEGKEKPADDSERLELAQLCQEPFKELYAASVRLYTEALANFSSGPTLAQQWHRYNAACAAALGGCGRGKDTGQLEDKERARLRQQALDWLKADLAVWAQQAESDQPQARTTVRQRLRHWQTDTDLAGVRDQEALAKLPAEERTAWQQLWAEVTKVLKKAGANP
jgi:serine/threonine-protein kinase